MHTHHGVRCFKKGANAVHTKKNTLHDMKAYYQDYICLHMYARPIAGAFFSLPSTFRLLNLLIFINFINIMLPLDYGYIHNNLYIHSSSIRVFRAGFGRFRPVSLGFVKKKPLIHHPKFQSRISECMRW